MKKIFTILTLALCFNGQSQTFDEVLSKSPEENKLLFLSKGYSITETTSKDDNIFVTYDLTDSNDKLKFIECRVVYLNEKSVSLNIFSTSLELYDAYQKFCEINAVKGIKYNDWDFVYRTQTITFLFDEFMVEGVMTYLITIYVG